MNTTSDADPMTASFFLFERQDTGQPWPRPSTTMACSDPETS